MRASSCIGWLLGAGLVAGCGAPPSEASSELGLRAALLSTTDAIAALPLEQRMGLATRMEAAAQEQRAAGRVAATPASLTIELLDAFDEPRSVDGHEAIVVLAVDHGPSAASLHTLSDAADGGAPSAAPHVGLVLVDAELFEDPAARALAGRAGEIVQRMARETGAHEVAIRGQMPAGLLGDRERIYVNPVWLLLLASVDEHDDVGRTGAELIGPYERVGHHRTESDGWGCYGSPCVTTSTGCGPPTCSCGRCGWDCGECACECGPDSDSVHCATAEPPPTPGSPLDWIWVLAPVAYLLVRRRVG